MLLFPSRVRYDRGAGSFCEKGDREEKKKKKKAVLIHLVFESSTLLASPQAVILADLRLSRGRPGLVIAQKNPQAGKREAEALEQTVYVTEYKAFLPLSQRRINSPAQQHMVL